MKNFWVGFACGYAASQLVLYMLEQLVNMV